VMPAIERVGADRNRAQKGGGKGETFQRRQTSLAFPITSVGLVTPK
jgi:hypothetical protein